MSGRSDESENDGSAPERSGHSSNSEFQAGVSRKYDENVAPKRTAHVLSSSEGEFLGFPASPKVTKVKKTKKLKKIKKSKPDNQPLALPGPSQQPWTQSKRPVAPWQQRMPLMQTDQRHQQQYDDRRHFQRPRQVLNLLRGDDSDSAEDSEEDQSAWDSSVSGRSRYSRGGPRGQPLVLAPPQVELPTATVPMDHPSEVSLDKHLQNLTKQDDVGPPVHDTIATIAEGTWNSENKELLKSLLESTKRPANTPSLQKVDIDEELMMNLMTSRRPKDVQLKKQDYHLKTVHSAIVKSAVIATQMANLAYTAKKDDDIRQQMVDKSCEMLRIMSYGAAQLHPIRRNNIKGRLNASIRHALNKTSLETTNTTHFLFGGDLNKQAKEGELAMAIKIWFMTICQCASIVTQSTCLLL